ncbi:hypothetical protein [Paraburkholderia youngii]|uniref:hypothetical protein n=1 Tax=Paraburkholderia youngii TaxID=2782701 RepID=UPI003D1ED84C
MSLASIGLSLNFAMVQSGSVIRMYAFQFAGSCDKCTAQIAYLANVACAVVRDEEDGRIRVNWLSAERTAGRKKFLRERMTV